MYHIRLSTDESKVVKTQAERCGVSANALAAIILKAAVAAVKDHRGRLIPPTFELLDEVIAQNRLNEPTPKTSYTRK